jgi:hypothetical protein
MVRLVTSVIAVGVLWACSLDLERLHGVALGGSTGAEVAGGTSAVTGGVGSTGGAGGKTGSFSWLAFGGSSSTAPCGSVGASCCTNNRCNTGICLRGRCSVFAGVYQSAAACSSSCQTRDRYTAGCSCPAGFSPEPAIAVPVTCSDGSEQSAQLTICATSGTVAADWSGIWVKSETSADCAGACIIANGATGDCTCPDAAVEIAVEASVSSSCNRAQSARLGWCLSSAIATATFAGVYQSDASSASSCSAPNPLTGGCSCPESATDQQIDILNKSFHVCTQ